MIFLRTTGTERAFRAKLEIYEFATHREIAVGILFIICLP